jgi:hypothetical protein
LRQKHMDRVLEAIVEIENAQIHRQRHPSRLANSKALAARRAREARAQDSSRPAWRAKPGTD